MEEKIPRTVPDEIDVHRRIWVRAHRTLRTVHYLLGTIGTICAITVASQPSFVKSVPSLIEVLAWVSALSISLITYLMPLRTSKGYVAAARILTDSCNRYKLDPDFTMKELLDAVRKGEELISQLDDIS